MGNLVYSMRWETTWCSLILFHREASFCDCRLNLIRVCPGRDDLPVTVVGARQLMIIAFSETSVPLILKFEGYDIDSVRRWCELTTSERTLFFR